MIKRWMSKTALFALALACASTGAYAVPIDTIDFEDVASGLYTAPSSFTTTANLGTGNTYSFNVNAGNAAVDNSSLGSASNTACIGNGGTGCSINGTQALYMFSSSGNGSVTLLPSAGNMLSLSTFDAAVATISPGVCFPDPSLCLFVIGGNTLSTAILVSGTRNPGFGFDPTAVEFDLSPPVNEAFTTQGLFGELADFINLDSITFAFNGASSFCNAGCSGDFAIDNLNVTLTPTQGNPPPPPPNNVPEPGTLGLLVTGLIGLGITRRRKPRSA